MRNLASVGNEGLGFGLVRNHIDRALCLLITMSRIGYKIICLDGKMWFI